ncbi:hypothetical protein [Sinorhizobium meliloti]|uniref:hypothetical protein n=1 Tax=Rhizobium meliloti TaxID=382 RepID=UPI00129613E9|nr:hypothetical protein [Sinorhizobium meliloti]MDW9491717.1 hypothetical protein [Sinorhizobium meliloti]MQV02983.1 hypothetical protein [Sinorhizobium meliloti]
MSQENKPFKLPAGLEKTILGRHLKALENANEELRRQIASWSKRGRTLETALAGSAQRDAGCREADPAASINVGLDGSVRYASGDPVVFVDPSQTAYLLDKPEAVEVTSPQSNVGGIKEWDHKDRSAIQKGEVRSYKGRRFIARHNIPVDKDTNAPGYSEFWEEVE